MVAGFGAPKCLLFSCSYTLALGVPAFNCKFLGAMGTVSDPMMQVEVSNSQELPCNRDILTGTPF